MVADIRGVNRKTDQKPYPMAAGVAFDVGDFVYLTALSLAVPPNHADAEEGLGRALQSVSNADGADSDRSVNVRRRGSGLFVQDGTLSQVDDETLVGFTDATTVSAVADIACAVYLHTPGDPPEYAYIEWGMVKTALPLQET